MAAQGARILTQNSQNPVEADRVAGSEYFEDDLRRVDRLLDELRAVDVQLRIEGGRLIFNAPPGVMSDDLLARVRADREAVLARLKRATDPPSRRPVVVHLKREPFDIRIDRASRWGNPFRIGPDGDRDEVIVKYRQWIGGRPDLLAALPELRGKRLGCWCAPSRCHGDVLADLVEALDSPPAGCTESDSSGSSIVCPDCRGVDLVDDPAGVRCQSCGGLAWILTPEGGLVRRDFAQWESGIDLVDPGAVPACPSCGDLCDVQTLADAWRCSRCDPEDDLRRGLTLRVLSLVGRSR